MTPLTSYMKLTLRQTVLSVALAAAAMLPMSSHAEIKKLVTVDNISATKTINETTHQPSNLLYDSDGKYHTMDDEEGKSFVDGEQYLQVDLNKPLSLKTNEEDDGDNEDLIVFVQRCHDCVVRQPTAFRVEGFLPGPDAETNPESGTWTQICYIYFLYRGRSTREYSARIHPDNGYTKLRFYVTENNSRNFDAKGHRSMGLRQFQVYQVPRNETVGGRIDPVHLDTDYKRDYEHYDFVHTMGWLDSRNRDKEKTTENKPIKFDDKINNEAHTKGEKTWQDNYIKGINDWAKWTEDWESDGTWKLDNDKLEELGITMPNMGLITSDVDFTATANDDGRQATHEMEHILYAVPGDPIILYPYYKFANPKHYEKYEVNFAHWYDYRTGGRIIYDDNHVNKMDLLDFIVDPSQICITENNGFYGGYLLTEKGDNIPGIDSQNYGMFATFFCPRNPLDDRGDVKTLPFRDIDIASGTNDVNEYVIAADFSQSFNKGRNIDETVGGKEKIIEPNISFRHIFRIRDGKEFADKFSGSAALNQDYIAKNSRQVTARAGQEFQIGLDGGIPIPIQDGSWWRCAPSKYYYKVSNTDYRRVLCMGIRVIGPNGNPIANYFNRPEDENNNGDPYNTNNYFYFDRESFRVGDGWDVPEFTGLGHRTDGVYYGVGGGSVVEGEEWKYSRLLKTKRTDLKGKYTVQLIGEEIIGENAPTPIKVFGSTTEDLIVLQYVIDFVDSEKSDSPQALLVSGDDLYDNDKFKFAREEELKSKYGKPKDMIDFDQYRYLETLDNKKEYLKEGEIAGQYRFKWPASWEKSNYGFGYAEGHNYNMYTVANHSNMTQYHNKWHGDKWGASNDGLRDVLYWKTEKLKKKNAPSTRAEGDEEETPTAKENNNGYFLYVNAANDPGVMITLDAGQLCTGSTINVSAWVAEFSKQPERANLVFNLVAVLEGTGERINVHSYVSGYLPVEEAERGKWYKIFYSFQPNLDHIGYTSNEIHHYEIELENNCKSSDGADYAIDEISIYIVTPVIGAEQETPLCLDMKEATDKTVKVFSPFDELRRSIGLGQGQGSADAETVKLSYVVLDKKNYDDAYKEAVADENDKTPGTTAFNTDGVKIQAGEVEFSSDFTQIPAYDTITAFETAGSYTDDKNNKMVAFKVNINDANFTIGKEYYIAIYAQAGTEKIDEEQMSDDLKYDLQDKCAKKCIFKVAAKNNIRIDGIVNNQTGTIKVCEGESPKVSIDVKTDGENGKVTENAVCDWYKGTQESYYDIKDASGLSLYKAMSYFREAYPKATGPEDPSVKTDNFFTASMLELIKTNKENMVFLATYYQFAALYDKDVVTALPIPYSEEESEQTVCTSPMEINIEVYVPEAVHGIRGVAYPEEIKDVPLRIGLDQLRSVSVDMDKDMATGQKMLVIPLKTATPSGVVEVETSLATGESTFLTLESTDDDDPQLKETETTSTSGETYLVKRIAGEVKAFTAQLDEESDKNFSVVFDEEFPFKEGYSYTFSYQYKEVMPDGVDHVCVGKDNFTIKVVPEFLEWTGGDSRNWNNDANWKRVSSSDLNTELTDKDLYVEDEEAVVSARLNDKVTDGKNDNIGAYMPMDFTKVIIPATSEDIESPFMYAWGVESEAAGAATENIQYDMVAKNTESNVECGLWYANTCKEIHFLPSATIMNQQHLKYEKAWVDLELTPSRWYTLAMPLKKVFAGEFYLPTATARQETELFQPITYDTEKNDRFNPAVFQRGWDKGSADIYHPNDKENPTSAVVKANWSHVYNDVQESYGSGVGFSIKTDVSRFEEAPEKVLFRLPKADESYDYYDVNGDMHNVTHETKHGNDHYQLNATNGSITATTAGTKYFLVGNPFMTYLDMATFLAVNSDNIEQKYWMITSGTQKSAVFDADGEISGNAIGYVAPMQGFFVEAKESVVGNTLTLNYDETMMADAATVAASSPLKIVSRGYDEGFTLTISAFNDGEESTAAVVKVAPEASCDYIAEEDMVVIDNSDLEVRATVYTVGDGKALAVNSLDAIGNVELGLIALPREETILRFDLDGDCALNLYDAETGAYTPIYDGMTYPVSGNASGRLYLTASCGVETLEASSISWRASGDELTVWSNDADCKQLSVWVYDYAGRIVAAQSADCNEVRLAIGSGVYVLEAETESERICLQVIIR